VEDPNGRDEDEEEEDGLLDPSDFAEDSENEEYNTPLFRLGRNLLKMGKVSYRHVHNLPEWVERKHDEIVAYRTPAQIRRCMKNWMFKTDREMQQRYRHRKLTWRYGSQDGELDVLAYGPEETVAYAHYFMPSRFSITKRIFNEMKMLTPDFAPTRIIDLGCGPGTAGAAAIDVWGGGGKVSGKAGQVAKYVGVDMSRAMLDAAKVMLTQPEDPIASPLSSSSSSHKKSEWGNYVSSARNVSFPRPGDEAQKKNVALREHWPDCVFWDRSADLVRKMESGGERFDLSVCSYTLSELANDPTRRAATQLAFEMLDVGGCMLILEGGSPYGSHTVRTARQFLLDNFRLKSSEEEDEELRKGGSKTKKQLSTNEADASHPIPPFQHILPPPHGFSHKDVYASVVSPCTHDGTCPLLDGVWCSFSQKVYSGMIRKASEEKFSYVVIQKLARKGVGRKGGAPLGGGGIDATEWATSSSSSSLSASNVDGAQKDKHMSPLSILVKLRQADLGNRSPKDVQDVMEQVGEDMAWDTYNPIMVRNEWARVLRSPIKAKGHVTMDLCVPTASSMSSSTSSSSRDGGSVTRVVLSKSNMLQVPSLYTSMRKTTWGGLFPVLIDETEASPLAQKALRSQNNRWTKPSRDAKLGKERQEEFPGREEEEEEEEDEEEVQADDFARKRRFRTNAHIKHDEGPRVKKEASTRQHQARSKEEEVKVEVEVEKEKVVEEKRGGRRVRSMSALAVLRERRANRTANTTAKKE